MIPVTLVVLAAGYFVVRYLGGIDSQKAFTSVSIEENWNKTITSLGVAPIFPPEEDLVVGDVLAVVVRDRDPDPLAQDDSVERKTFISKSVKLAHIDVTAALDEAYKDLPVFPATVAANLTATAGNPPKLRESVARKFSDAVLQGNLPRAAFPRLKIQGTVNAAAGIAANGSGSASYGAGSQQVEEFELTDVRTYGLPSVAALALFEDFCEQNKMSVCKEATARKHLERVVGDRIYRKFLYKSNELRYTLEVELVMVYRVYLTGSIVDLRRTASNQKAGLMALWPFGTSQDPPPPMPEVDSAPRPPAIPANGAATDQFQALNSRLDDLEQRLSKVKRGAALNYQSSYGNESSLGGKFERPVAIGYRSVQRDFVSEKSPQPSQ